MNCCNNWQGDDSCPVKVKVKEESVKFLSESNAFTVPKIFIPPVMHNNGNYIISLGSFCKWLSVEAEKLGVEIYPGFAKIRYITQ